MKHRLVDVYKRQGQAEAIPKGQAGGGVGKGHGVLPQPLTLPVVIVLPQMVQEGGEGLLCLVIFQIAFKCQTVAFYLKIV